MVDVAKSHIPSQLFLEYHPGNMWPSIVMKENDQVWEVSALLLFLKFIIRGR